MTLQIKSDNVNTKQGVPISCIGVAQVKIESRQEQMLSTACTHFLGKEGLKYWRFLALLIYEDFKCLFLC